MFGKFDGSQVGFNPQPDPPGDPVMQVGSQIANLSAVMLNPQPLPPKEAMLTLETRAALTAGSIGLVRDALIANVNLIQIYWCYWEWLWPWFRYSCEELTVIETDEHGRFDTTIYYPCFGDHPDLYFWVEYSIGGTWTTVYHPPLPCYTYWNYVCGTDVTIRITDPRVHGCGDQPELLGKKVVVKTIARQVSMGEIYRDSVVPSEKAKEGQVKEGWIDASLGLGVVKSSPFGSVLEPRVDFGNGLKGANITHYRWSYRPLGSVDENDWKVLDDIQAGRTVSRHYRETSGPGDPVVYKSVQIGPDTAAPGGYYTLIDPVLPANGEDWEVLDESYDLASAYFNTHLNTPDLIRGKFEMKLELFRKVGASMVRVDLTAEGVELYEITDPAPLVEGSYTTMAATNDRVLIDAGTGHVVGYRLVVHIDNRKCHGNIDDVTVNMVPAGHCGFLEYNNLSDTARISFHASHPDNFAAFHFRVVRVTTNISEALANGLVEAASVNGYTSRRRSVQQGPDDQYADDERTGGRRNAVHAGGLCRGLVCVCAGDRWLPAVARSGRATRRTGRGRPAGLRHHARVKVKPRRTLRTRRARRKLSVPFLDVTCHRLRQAARRGFAADTRKSTANSWKPAQRA